jgi:3-oxoadipate enol-lactonase
VESLRHSFMCVTLDLRGHGESDKPDSPMTIDDMAEDVLSLISDAAGRPAVIVGHSMGGYVALRSYKKHPAAFAGMVLLNSRAEADPPEVRKARLETAAKVLGGGGDSFRHDFAARLLSEASKVARPALGKELLGMMEGVPDYAIARALEAMAGRADSLPMLPEISVPTLIVCGADDRVIPTASAEVMKSGIPGSRLLMIPRVGHMANMEDPTTFNSAVGAFLGELTKG